MFNFKVVFHCKKLSFLEVARKQLYICTFDLAYYLLTIFINFDNICMQYTLFIYEFYLILVVSFSMIMKLYLILYKIKRNAMFIIFS